MADKRGISGRNWARLDNTLGVPTFVLSKDVLASSTTSVVADAPFAFRIIDAWSIGTTATGGTWRLNNGSADITTDVTQGPSNYDVDRADNIVNTYYTISKGDGFDIITGVGITCTVYVLCVRV